MPTRAGESAINKSRAASVVQSETFLATYNRPLDTYRARAIVYRQRATIVYTLVFALWASEFEAKV